MKGLIIGLNREMKTFSLRRRVQVSLFQSRLVHLSTKKRKSMVTRNTGSKTPQLSKRMSVTFLPLEKKMLLSLNLYKTKALKRV